MTETSLTLSKLTALANPTRFIALATRIIPWLAAISALCLIAGVYLSFTTEGDYQQGDTVRIMYIHVPSAWLSMMCYTVMAASALGTLVWRHPLADVSAKTAAPLGAAFTFLALVTGSLWGKPMWGTWWVWDARLTSVLILFLLYLGYLALRAAIEDEQKSARAAAILALVGLVNLPIIHYSVVWWNSLHQGQTIRVFGESSMDSSMTLPLVLMVIATKFWFAGSLLARARADNLRREAGKDWVAKLAAANGAAP